MPALWMAFAPLVWALHFTALYGVTAVACARGVSALIPGAIVIATVVAMAAMLAIVKLAHRARDHFIRWISRSLAGLGVLAIVFEAVTVLLVPACPP